MQEIGAGSMAERVGVPVRSIQFWTDAAVLRPLPETERMGRGRHRVYPANPPWFGELVWAFIAAELNRLALPVGTMRRVIDLLRRNAVLLDTTEPSRWAQSMMFHPVGRALQGHQALIIVPLPLADRWINVEINEAERKPEILHVFGPDPNVGIGEGEEEPQYSKKIVQFPGDFVTEHRSGYLLNLFKILEPLRTG